MSLHRVIEHDHAMSVPIQHNDGLMVTRVLTMGGSGFSMNGDRTALDEYAPAATEKERPSVRVGRLHVAFEWSPRDPTHPSR